MEPQQGGDEDGLARGAWDWSLLWKRVPLSQREKAKRQYTTQPYRYTLCSQNANTHPCSVCVPISHPSILPVLCSVVSHCVLVLTSIPCVFVFLLPLSVFAVFVFFVVVFHCVHLFPPCMLCAWPPAPHHCVRTVCTVPLIDSIHGQKFTMEPQGGGDEDGFARGAWDWSMLWKRVPLGDREKNLRKSRTEPYRYRQQSLQTTQTKTKTSNLTCLTLRLLLQQLTEQSVCGKPTHVSRIVLLNVRIRNINTAAEILNFTYLNFNFNYIT